MIHGIFPPRNLPPAAVDWGRAIENEIEVDERGSAQVTQAINNGLRAFSGQAASSSERITELFNRSMEITSVGDASVPAGGSSTSAAFSTLSSPYSGFFTLDFSVSSSVSDGGTLGVSVVHQGSPVLTGSVTVTDDNSRQPSFFRNLGTFSGGGRAVIGAGISPVFDIQFSGQAGRTFTVSNIVATLTRTGGP